MKITFQPLPQPTPPKRVIIELEPDEAWWLAQLCGNISGGVLYQDGRIDKLAVEIEDRQKCVSIRKLTYSIWNAIHQEVKCPPK